MKHKLKKILSLVLLCVVGLWLLSSAALAEPEGETDPLYIYTKITSEQQWNYWHGRNYSEGVKYLVVNERDDGSWVLTGEAATYGTTKGLVCQEFDTITADVFISSNEVLRNNLWCIWANNTGDNDFFPYKNGISDKAGSITIYDNGDVILEGGAYNHFEYKDGYFLVSWPKVASGTWINEYVYLDHYYYANKGFVAGWAPGAGEQKDSPNRRWTIYVATPAGAFNVVYDLNGGSCSDAELVVTDITDSQYTIPEKYRPTAAAANQQFIGWKDAAGNIYSPGDTIELKDKLTTLTAQYGTVTDACFFMRPDGVIPPEDGSTQYGNNEYWPSVYHNLLPGEVLGETMYTEYSGVVQPDGTINGVALSDAFRKVNLLIKTPPTAEAINQVLRNNNISEDDLDKYGVAWYVIKSAQSCSDHLHVDGVLYRKAENPTGEFRVINYVRNDSSTSVTTVVFEKGAVATIETESAHSSLRDDFFTRNGYKFLGWSTDKDATTADEKYDGTTVTMNDDLTLYAVWEPIMLSYTVQHVVDGEARDVKTYSQHILETENNQLKVQEGSLTPLTYPGYKADSFPTEKVGDKVADGAVLTISYVRDDAQTKTLVYHVEYRVDSSTGTLLAQEDISVTIWAGDDSYSVTSVPKKKFSGYVRSVASTQLPVTVKDDDTIYVIYREKSSSSSDSSSNTPALNLDDHIAYIIGYEDGTVRPNENISRAEVVTIFFRLLQADVRDGNLTAVNTFSDVNEGQWFNKAVSTMAKLGIIEGRSDEVFDPNAMITRAEFAAICARFDTSQPQGESSFADIAGHWAEAEIKRATALGWVIGYGDENFHPDQPITRAEAVTIINRVLCRIPEDEDDLLDGMNIWPDNQPGMWYYLDVQEATNSHYYIHKGESYETWTELTVDPDWERYK